jgi:RNA polymerase sigma factor (TIGR02999 family)
LSAAGAPDNRNITSLPPRTQSYLPDTISTGASGAARSRHGAWAGGNHTALEELTPRFYDELRRIAARFMKDNRPGNTIQATALVHEAYLKLIDITNVDWQHRAHFFAVSAQIMRRISLDRARRRFAVKRGGAAPRINLEEVPDFGSGRAREPIALDDALNVLTKIDERKARVIELRFFGGLSVGETAEVLKV